MKRDMDLVRNILLAIESEEKPLEDSTLRPALKKFYKDNSSFPTDLTILAHIKIMAEAKLVSVKLAVHYGEELPHLRELRMTYDGQDFLASALNPSIWQKVRPKMPEMTIDLIKQTLACLMKAAMKP